MLQAWCEEISKSGSHVLKKHDLYSDPPPYYDEHIFNYLWQPLTEPGYLPDATEQNSARYLIRHCQDFNAAELVVISAPVWNFSIPAILKAWIDLIIAPNHTYRFAPGGIVPLHRVQRILFLISSGGRQEKVNVDNHFLSVLMAPFRYIGIGDFDVIWADGQEASRFDDHQVRLQRAAEKAVQHARDLTGQTLK